MRLEVSEEGERDDRPDHVRFRLRCRETFRVSRNYLTRGWFSMVRRKQGSSPLPVADSFWRRATRSSPRTSRRIFCTLGSSDVKWRPLPSVSTAGGRAAGSFQ